MNYTRKIVYLFALSSSFMMLASDTTKSLSNYIQRRNQKTKERKEGTAAIRAKRANKPWLRDKPPAKRRVTQTLAEVASDAIWVNLGLFSWDSVKIFVTTAPFFVGARMIDEKLHHCFFDQRHKKNRYEPAQWIKETARLSIGIPITLLGLQAVFSHNDDMQKTSQIFLTGMPFVLLAKDIIKKLDFDVCKRPFHEKFAKHQRKFGGFPSGHLAEATYTAVLYGMRYGPNFALPLGSIAVFVGVIFLSSNRHYLSQMIAGAGFGAMYAFSANRLINSRLAQKRDFNLGLTRDDYGNPAMQLSMKF
jgi:PAP2 superfamily